MIGAGVGKPGSPAPNPMTFSPAAFSALALASTARVADSAMAPTRSDTRVLTAIRSCGDRPRWGHEMTAPLPDIAIPDDLLPNGGRFGCGPSKVRPEAVAALAKEADEYLGTSHRQAPVRF